MLRMETENGWQLITHPDHARRVEGRLFKSSEELAAAF